MEYKVVIELGKIFILFIATTNQDARQLWCGIIYTYILRTVFRLNYLNYRKRSDRKHLPVVPGVCIVNYKGQ